MLLEGGGGRERESSLTHSLSHPMRREGGEGERVSEREKGREGERAATHFTDSHRLYPARAPAQQRRPQKNQPLSPPPPPPLPASSSLPIFHLSSSPHSSRLPYAQLIPAYCVQASAHPSLPVDGGFVNSRSSTQPTNSDPIRRSLFPTRRTDE
jgi:hypothetical protein